MNNVCTRTQKIEESGRSHYIARRIVVLFVVYSSINAKHAMAAENSQFTTPEIEVLALTRMFFETNGPNWSVKYGWDSLLNDTESSDPCEYPCWYVVCVGSSVITVILLI